MRRDIFSVVIGIVILFSSCGNKEEKQQSSKNVVAAINDTDELKIISKPVLFDSVRKQLTLQYIYHHYGLKHVEPTIQPEMIVIHHTAIDSFDSSYQRMYGSVLPGVRKDILRGGILNVSAHYLVDRDGTIYQLLPDTVFARHVIDLDLIAIGIENVGGNKLPLTQAQLIANERLVRYLVKQHPAIEWMIGHKEYSKFRKSKLWVEKDSKYFTVKNDPAGNFLTELRSRLSDLKLKSKPGK